MELYVFDSRLKKMKMVLTNQNIVEAHEVTQINTAGQLTFTTTMKSDVDEKIETTDIVFVKVKDDRYHPYKIVQSNMPTPNTIQYTCIEYAYYLFAKDGLVHDKRPTKLSVAETITQIIMGTKWKVGYTDPNLPTFTGNFYWQTRTDCFKELVEGTGAELEFYMTMADNKITSRTIEAYKQRGTDTHQRFTYGMNALEVIAEEDATNAVTKVYPRGSGEMYTSDGDGQRKLTISDVEWSKAKGDPTDKPKGQDYLVYGSSKYDLDNGNQPSAIVEFQNEKDANNLIRKAFNWLKQNNRPKVQFKAKVSDVGDLKLGDRVVIDREDLGIKYVTRVFKLDRNLLNEKLNTIELGDVVAHTLADVISNVSSSLADTNKRVDNVSNTIVDGNGNTVTYGPNEPTTKKKGDTWYKPGDIVDGIQQYDVYVWDGEKWVLTIGNQLQNELLSKVEQAQKDTEEAKQQAQQASDKADQIVIDFNKQIGDVQTDINGAKADAQTAIAQADAAIQKADFNNKEITEIKQKQDADGQRISSVEQNYNGLKQTVSDNATKQESDRVQLSNLIQDKVSNGEFNSFKTQTSSQISSLVSNGGNLFPNAEFNDKNLSSYFNIVYRDATVETGVQANTKTGNYLKIQNTDLRYNTRLEVKGIIPASPGDKLNIAYDYLKNTNTSTPVVGFIARKRDGGDGWYYIRGEKTATDGKWKHIEQTWTVPQNVMGLTPIVMNLGNEDGVAGDYICFDNVLITRTDITKTEVTQIQNGISSLAKDQSGLSQRLQTTEGIVDVVKSDVDSTKAQLSLLSDNINLKVDKDKVINQINVSTEGILIDGKKTHITNQTIIDNAVITSAMIKDINADKITTGTLNAQNVKIVNLDVNTLGGDYATFLKTAWKDSNSYSEITADGMKFFKKGTSTWDRSSYLNVYSSQLSWKTDRKAWHYISQTTDDFRRSTLTLAGVTNGDTVPASVGIRIDAFDCATFVSKNSHYGGRYVIIGSLEGQNYSDGMDKAESTFRQAKDTNGETFGDFDSYGVRITAQNDICLNTTSTDLGIGVRFCRGLGEPNDMWETRIVNQGQGMVIKSRPTYSRTYSGSANLFIADSGYIGRSTSARKYKQDIEYIDNINEAKKTLDIQPAEWADKKVMESRARARATGGELTESLRRRYIGFIADDFADAGFEKLILRDNKGEVEEFQYDRLSVYHHQMIKDLYNQIDTLKNEIKELKGDN